MNPRTRTSAANRKSDQQQPVTAASVRKLNASQSPVETHPDRPNTLQPLSPSEQTEMNRCEETIAKGWHTFVEVGKALAIIRDHRLYRTEHSTFETYCRLKWQFGRAYAYRLITAAEVVACVSTIGDIPLPENEAQVRPLIGLTQEQTKKVWIEAVSE